MASDVRLDVFNILGRRLAILVDEKQEAGYYEVVFKDKSIASGMYIYGIHAGDFISSKKLLLLR